MGFTDEQKALMRAPLDRANVKARTQGNTSLSYIEGWHAIAEANRIFGEDGWTRETIDLIENHAPDKNAKDNFVVSFRARVRISAGGISRDGIGFGSGIARSVADAYEGAVKEAETDAMKRALMTFGNPFGLALYDKSQANVEDAAQREHARQIEQCRQALLGASTAESFTQGREQLFALNPPLETVRAILTEVAGMARKHGLAWDAGAKRYVPDDIPAQGGAK
jgi:DNA repair and recombination protein RAD52